MGYNYTTADWVLFLDDDVIPEPAILDAYAGAIKQYPEGKVFVGLTNLQFMDTNALYVSWLFLWYCKANGETIVGCICKSHGSWRSIKPYHPVQADFSKTGGGEDINFVYQYKKWHHDWKDSSNCWRSSGRC